MVPSVYDTVVTNATSFLNFIQIFRGPIGDALCMIGLTLALFIVLASGPGYPTHCRAPSTEKLAISTTLHPSRVATCKCGDVGLSSAAHNRDGLSAEAREPSESNRTQRDEWNEWERAGSN